MRLTEVTPAPLTPVPLREFASHLRLSHGFEDDGAEDALLELYLRNAVAVIERRTATALIRRPFRLEVASWGARGCLTLPVGPVSEIGSVTLEGGSTATAVPVENFRISPDTHRQSLTGPAGRALSAIPPGRTVVFTFDAGFGDSWNDVPNDLRQAVLLLAARFYEDRGGEAALDDGLPNGVARMLAPFSPVRI